MNEWENLENDFEINGDKENLDEIADEVYTEMAAEENKRYEELKTNLEFFKSNIDYDYEFVEEYIGVGEEDLRYFSHIGYVNVEKSDHRNMVEQNRDYYIITGDDFDKINYGIQDQSFEHTFHVLVFQTTGYCEDDYSGFLLFPMKDGRYWKISFWS